MLKLCALLVIMAFSAAEAAPAPSPALAPLLASGYALSPAVPLASSGQTFVRDFSTLAAAPLAYAPLAYNPYAYAAPAYYI